MRFIIDESTGKSVANYLRSKGFDTVAVSEAMPKATDFQILIRARNEKRILVTNDLDFGELVFRNGQNHSGILLLRLHDETPANRIRVVKAVIEQFGNRLPNHFVVATENGIRIRRMSDLS